jgi:hypothetical protein
MNKKREKPSKIDLRKLINQLPVEKRGEAQRRIVEKLGWSKPRLYGYRCYGLSENYYGLKKIYQIIDRLRK